MDSLLFRENQQRSPFRDELKRIRYCRGECDEFVQHVENGNGRFIIGRVAFSRNLRDNDEVATEPKKRLLLSFERITRAASFICVAVDSLD